MPEVGRFGQVDPITETQENYSTYQYGWGNPVLRSDPNGDCPTCPEGYSNPTQVLYQGLSQIATAASNFIDKFSLNITNSIEKTIINKGNNATINNTTSTETSLNTSASLSYIKANNTNVGNTSAILKTTVTNETSISTKKELKTDLANASIKSPVSNSGKSTLETKADAKINKVLSVGATTSINTNGDKKMKVDVGTGFGSATAKIFGQLTNSIKTTAIELGINLNFEDKTKNINSRNSVSIKYKTENK